MGWTDVVAVLSAMMQNLVGGNVQRMWIDWNPIKGLPAAEQGPKYRLSGKG